MAVMNTAMDTCSEHLDLIDSLLRIAISFKKVFNIKEYWSNVYEEARLGWEMPNKSFT
jgi:hypothetical protein